MHEASIAANILSLLETRIADYPGSSASLVTILVGEFRNVDEDALRFAFDALKQDIAGVENCHLIVESSALLARCAKMQHLYHPDVEHFYRCSCGSGMGNIVKGQELDVIGCTLSVRGADAVCTK